MKSRKKYLSRIYIYLKKVHTEQHGAEIVEWIALVAVILILLIALSAVFNANGSQIGQSITDNVTCWTGKWSSGGSCGGASGGGSVADAGPNGGGNDSTTGSDTPSNTDADNTNIDNPDNSTPAADDSNEDNETNDEGGGGIRGWFRDRFSDIGGIVDDIGRVDWNGSWDTEGLEGDWGALYGAWALGTRPDDFGQWSTNPDDGKDLVTITSDGYINDLKSKPNYDETLDVFRNTYPSIDDLAVGDTISNMFLFTGQGTTTGDYNALEWFLGSYGTTVTVTGINRETGEVTVDVNVRNRSHWESGTRVPGSWQDRGIPPYLIPNGFGDVTGLGETYWQEFVWEDQIQYPIGSSGRSKNVPVFDFVAWQPTQNRVPQNRVPQNTKRKAVIAAI